LAQMAQKVVFAVKFLGTAGPFTGERRNGRPDVREVMSHQILWITATGVAAALSLTLVAMGLIGMCFLMVPTRSQPLITTRLIS
jgi:hypothetical protein